MSSSIEYIENEQQLIAFGANRGLLTAAGQEEQK